METKAESPEQPSPEQRMAALEASQRTTTECIANLWTAYNRLADVIALLGHGHMLNDETREIMRSKARPE